MKPTDLSLDEHGPYYVPFINLVPENLPIIPALDHSAKVVQELMESLPLEKHEYRYAPGKWTIKQVLLHLADTERIFMYRALRFARKDHTTLVGFEQDDFVANAKVSHRSLNDLLYEYQLVRQQSIGFLQTLSDEELLHKGIASNNQVSVRGIAYITAGHDLHHCKIIQERYL